MPIPGRGLAMTRTDVDLLAEGRFPVPTVGGQKVWMLAAFCTVSHRLSSVPLFIIGQMSAFLDGDVVPVCIWGKCTVRARRRDKGLEDGQSVGQSIVRLLIAHNPEAVELASDTWGQDTDAFALALVDGPRAAEDIVEAIFLTGWPEPDVVRRHAELRSFLLEAVFRGASDLRRRPLGSPQERSKPQASITATALPISVPPKPGEPSIAYRTRARRHSFFNPVWREYP